MAAKGARTRAETITKNGGSYDTWTVGRDITVVISMTFGVEP